MKQSSCTLSYPNKRWPERKSHTVNPLNASCGLSLLLVLSFAPRGKGEGRGDELKRLAAVLLTSYP